MRIVLDAMGSDDCPEPEVQAAIEAAHLFGDEVILVGPADQLKPKLQALAGPNPPVQLVDASDVIKMEDKGLALALKAKRKESKTSMAVGIDLVKNGQADAFVLQVIPAAPWQLLITAWGWSLASNAPV